jgi:hypothetical protein
VISCKLRPSILGYEFSMFYRSKLKAKLARKVSKTITAFGLIDDGDRVVVGLSGGKDSWALMQVLMFSGVVRW